MSNSNLKFQFLGELNPGVIYGKKAGNLDLLIKLGTPVPPGFVILHSDLMDAVSEDDLKIAVARIGGFPVAARSSATLEDLADASFAGQYESILQVQDVAKLKIAIQKCRSSAESEHAKAYLESKGLSRQAVQMNVLVQKMVNARVSGVAFSLHPVSGKENEALVEWCAGLGDKLVSGKINPSRGVIDLETKKLDRSPGTETAVLSIKSQGELVDQMLKIQAHFGCPQDIEWSVDQDGKLWILQTRPITKIAWRSDIEEYTNADFKDGGVSARVCTPFMASIYKEVFQNSMPTYLKKIKLLSKNAKPEIYINSFYGRVYWNASAVKRALKRVPGFDEKSFDVDIGVQKSYGKDGPIKTPVSLWTIIPAIPVALALHRNFKAALVKADAYGKTFLPKEAKRLKLAKRFPELSDEDFFLKLVEVLNLHHQTETDYFTTFYANSNYQSEFKKLLESVSKAVGFQVSTVSLLGGLEGVSHLESQIGLVKLYKIAEVHGLQGAEWKAGLKEFLAHCYFHGDVELDVSLPRWGENPARIEEIIMGWLTSGFVPRSPVETIAVQKKILQTEVVKIVDALKKKFWNRFRYREKFLKQLETSRNYLRSREKMREYSTRSYHLVRLYILEAGKRFAARRMIAAPDDIFMLKTQEIKAMCGMPVANDFEIFSKIAYRRLMYRGYRDLTPPDELGRGVQQLEYKTPPANGQVQKIWKGVGCSAGRTEGVVRVIKTLADAKGLGREDILVTRFTDPGWTPVLGMVKGVVTEVGGLLSHAAVIGREFGIPAVLNLPGATEVLKSGQRVIIDGTAGTVEVVG